MLTRFSKLSPTDSPDLWFSKIASRHFRINEYADLVNKKYIKAQLEGFLAGVPPEDFRGGGTNETVFKGYPGEKAVLGGNAGRDAMGFNLIAA